MQQLTAGANLVLAQPQCQIKIKTALPAHIDLDVSAYLLNAQSGFCFWPALGSG